MSELIKCRYCGSLIKPESEEGCAHNPANFEAQGFVPIGAQTTMNQPNQPAPKSAEEVPNEPTDELVAPLTYAPRYVTDEEIDAMWPDMYGFDMAKTLVQRQAAKAMRDKIFGGVKL